MSIAQLLDGDVDGWFRDQSDRDGLLWVFQHIPKTAGSSFRQEIAARLQPDANIHADHADRSRRAADSLQDALERFVVAYPQRQHRFASGHLRHAHVQRIASLGPQVRLVTMLRDPVARMVSDYRYMRTPSHPTFQDVIARYPSLADYVADPVTHNKMFKFLRPRGNSSVADVIADMERRFSFVGTQDDYSLALRTLLRLLGVDASPKVHTRRTVDSADNAVDELEQLRPRLEEANALDRALHDHFSSRLGAVRAALQQWLDERAPQTPAETLSTQQG